MGTVDDFSEGIASGTSASLWSPARTDNHGADPAFGCVLSYTKLLSLRLKIRISAKRVSLLQTAGKRAQSRILVHEAKLPDLSVHPHADLRADHRHSSSRQHSPSTGGPCPFGGGDRGGEDGIGDRCADLRHSGEPRQSVE